jgi:hypothetical protein
MSSLLCSIVSRARELYSGGVLAGWVSQYIGRRLTIVYVGLQFPSEHG